MSKKKVSWVWNFFKEVDGKEKTKCNLCSTELAYKKGSTTSGMLNHLKHVHKKNEGSESQPSLRQTSLLSYNKSKSTMGKVKYNDLCKSLALAVAYDLRPLSLVSGKGFKSFCQKLNPDFHVPSTTTVKGHLLLIYQSLKEDVIEQLANSPVSMTTDGWTSVSKDSYMTFTAHFINTDWQMKTVVLATRVLLESHTGENISNLVHEIADEFKIEDLVGLTTDGAGNMKAAAELSKLITMVCFAHTLQLGVNDGLSKVRQIRDALANTRRLVGHFSHSPKATNALRQVQKNQGVTTPQTLVQSVVTRWNSDLYMVKRLLKLRLYVFAVLHDNTVTNAKDKQLDLPDHQWVILEDLVNVLDPLEQCTEVLTKETSPTLCQVFILLKQLMQGPLVSNHEDSTAIRDLKSTIKAGLIKRFPINKEGDPTDSEVPALTASVLDPRYKSLKFLKEPLRGQVMNYVEGLLYKNPSKEVASQNAATVVKSEMGEEDSPETFSILQCLQGDIDLTIPDEKEKEFDAYIKEPVRISDPLQWWKDNQSRFPTVARLARQYLSIPATEVSSERVFSIAGLTLTHLRSRLDSNVVDATIFINKNYQFDEIVKDRPQASIPEPQPMMVAAPMQASGEVGKASGSNLPDYPAMPNDSDDDNDDSTAIQSVAKKIKSEY
jgi:hypothetical protein